MIRPNVSEAGGIRPGSENSAPHAAGVLDRRETGEYVDEESESSGRGETSASRMSLPARGAEFFTE